MRCSTDLQLQQILTLQQANTPEMLSPEALLQEGFVTVKHAFDLLKAMNEAEPHAIAVVDGQVVGYVLVMLRTFSDQIPILAPMFREFEKIPFAAGKLTDCRFFVCGQACVAKPYRGQGVLQALYQHLHSDLAGQYDLCLTEIAVKNPRSLRAHQRTGFRQLWQYDDGHELWNIVGWAW